jgi:hypothetical protein
MLSQVCTLHRRLCSILATKKNRKACAELLFASSSLRPCFCLSIRLPGDATITTDSLLSQPAPHFGVFPDYLMLSLNNRVSFTTCAFTFVSPLLRCHLFLAIPRPALSALPAPLHGRGTPLSASALALGPRRSGHRSLPKRLAYGYHHQAATFSLDRAINAAWYELPR